MGDSVISLPHQRLILPDSPPALASPGASSYSSKSSPEEYHFWGSSITAPISMPYNDKDRLVAMAPGQSIKGEQDDRTALEAQARRQQLPSLSSLFGPPPSSHRPTQSPPISESTSSHLGTTSPNSRPRLSLSHVQNQPAHFPQALSPVEPVSKPIFNPRSLGDWSPHYTHSAPFSSNNGASGSFEARHCHTISRTSSEASKKGNEKADGGLRETQPEPRKFQFQSPPDQFRLQFPATKRSNPIQSIPHTRSDSQLSPSLQAPSVSIPDIVLSKDGLGPKIWTGTHFLPRFVRAAEYPGEGLCYFYDDGSHCKTMIDGEAVNAHWGVTKAGKPRKRLAIACMTCREKKIKCDPDYPRCIQCEKFGRVCKFKNAPRGGQNTSPTTPTAELEDVQRVEALPQLNGNHGSLSSAGSPPSTNTRPRDPSPEPRSNKRLKTGSDSFAVKSEHPPPQVPEAKHDDFRACESLASNRPATKIPDEVLARAWQTDPCVSDLHSIDSVVSHFFATIESTPILRFLPEERPRAWLAGGNNRKSLDDLMLLYSILAIGMVLSGGPKHIASEYAQVAHYAQRNSHIPSLQLVQSRILLALYYRTTLSMSNFEEMISASTVAAIALRLDTELDDSKTDEFTEFPLGMSRIGYCEARRRTLWSLFMLERLGGSYSARPTMICSKDIYIRLPADLRSFDQQAEAETPLFEPSQTGRSPTPGEHLSIGAYLVEIVKIWADCQKAVGRSSRRRSYADMWATKQRGLMGKLEEWHASLPPRLLESAHNFESADVSGSLGALLTMHCLYRHSMIVLGRTVAARTVLSPESGARQVRQCNEHALSILDIFNHLDTILRRHTLELKALPPILATVVTEAVEILFTDVAGVSDSVSDKVRNLQHVLTSLGNVWDDWHIAKPSIEQRVYKMKRARE